jgi:CBS-domain-containing membrane protein
MLLTNTAHPPGGATALLAVIGGDQPHALEYLYVLAPTGAGACLLLLVAPLVNNLARHRRYPLYWW